MISNAFEEDFADCRHELKFVVWASDGAHLLRELEPFCRSDEHADEFRSYDVGSLYYDTSDFRFFWDREESVGYRRKVRLRTYARAGALTAAFLEIKEKQKHLIRKKRAKINNLSLFSQYPLHHEIPLSACLAAVEPSAEKREVEYLHSRLQLCPVLLNRYRRTTLITLQPPKVRITLDFQIVVGGSRLDVWEPERDLPLVPVDQAVLEVKTQTQLPLWLQSLLTKHEFVRTRYSKYCNGVRAVSTNQPLSPINAFRAES